MMLDVIGDAGDRGSRSDAVVAGEGVKWWLFDTCDRMYPALYGVRAGVVGRSPEAVTSARDDGDNAYVIYFQWRHQPLFEDCQDRKKKEHLIDFEADIIVLQ